MSSQGASGGVLEVPMLLQVDALRKEYRVRPGRNSEHTGHVIAVDDVSFDVGSGATFGVVGESGSGKTTLGRLVLGLEAPTEGSVRLSGVDVHGLRGKAQRRWRQEAQIIFQNPYGALAPRMRVLDAVEEPLAIQGKADRAERRRQAVNLLEAVGLSREYGRRYPHELSGGQRQRVVIARALVLRPKLVVCDEPTSALDVSVQAQVLALLRDLQHEFGLTYLFISHDLGVVRHMATELAVMYRGKIVEQGGRPTRCSASRFTRTRTCYWRRFRLFALEGRAGQWFRPASPESPRICRSGAAFATAVRSRRKSAEQRSHRCAR